MVMVALPAIVKPNDELDERLCESRALKKRLQASADLGTKTVDEADAIFRKVKYMNRKVQKPMSRGSELDRINSIIMNASKKSQRRRTRRGELGPFSPRAISDPPSFWEKNKPRTPPPEPEVHAGVKARPETFERMYQRAKDISARRRKKLEAAEADAVRQSRKAVSNKRSKARAAAAARGGRALPALDRSSPKTALDHSSGRAIRRKEKREAREKEKIAVMEAEVKEVMRHDYGEMAILASKRKRRRAAEERRRKALLAAEAKAKKSLAFAEGNGGDDSRITTNGNEDSYGDSYGEKTDGIEVAGSPTTTNMRQLHGVSDSDQEGRGGVSLLGVASSTSSSMARIESPSVKPMCTTAFDYSAALNAVDEVEIDFNFQFPDED